MPQISAFHAHMSMCCLAGSGMFCVLSDKRAKLHRTRLSHKNNKQLNDTTPTMHIVHRATGFYQRTGSILVFLILVLSISSCTENQQKAEREVKIVERIGADVALYQFHFKFGATRMSEVITAAQTLLEAVRNPDMEISEDDVALNIHKLTWLWMAAIPTTEYVAMVQSGEISLLRSERLRRKFKEMNNDLEKLLQFEALQISYVNQELRPFLNKRIDKTIYYSSQNFNSAGPVRVPSPFHDSAKDLLQDREFANLLVDVLFFTERIMLPYNRLQTIMADMETMIAEDYPTVSIEAYGPH